MQFLRDGVQTVSIIFALFLCWNSFFFIQFYIHFKINSAHMRRANQ